MPVTRSLTGSPGGGIAEDLVFDRRVLEDMFGQEPAVVAAVLATFLESMAASMEQLPGAVHQGGDLNLAVELAHRIKGAARMGGAMALGRAAQGLEELARAGDPVGSLQAAGQLDLQWQRLLSEPVLLGLASAPAAGSI